MFQNLPKEVYYILKQVLLTMLLLKYGRTNHMTKCLIFGL